MRLLCPECQGPGLEVGPHIELAADGESDEITLEVLRCADCRLLTLGLAEESHRGSSDDCWRHGAWKSEAGEIARVQSLIDACPRPSQRACGCDSHRALAGVKDDLRGKEGRFPVRFAPTAGEAD